MSKNLKAWFTNTNNDGKAEKEEEKTQQEDSAILDEIKYFYYREFTW